MYNWMIRAASAVTKSFLPLLAFQGMHVRKNIPRLPEASGPATGVVEIVGNPIELVVIGDSTVTGIGAPNHPLALSGQVATFLARYMECSVHWRALGKGGITAETARKEFSGKLFNMDIDVIVLALGVNDVIRFHSPKKWQRDLEKLIDAIQLHVGNIPIILPPIPAVGKFPALPQPLRGVYGLRAKALNMTTIELVKELNNVHYISGKLRGGKDVFALDGFHPSPKGYRMMGKMVGQAVAQILEPCDINMIY